MPDGHLTPGEREVIGQMAAAGRAFSEIGQAIGRHKSTISREIRRNSLVLGPGQGRLYLGSEAQKISQLRRRSCRRRLKLDDETLRRKVERHLTPYLGQRIVLYLVVTALGLIVAARLPTLS